MNKNCFHNVNGPLTSKSFDIIFYQMNKITTHSWMETQGKSCQQTNRIIENNTRNRKWPLSSNLRSSQLGSNWRNLSPSCWLGSNWSFPLKGQMKLLSFIFRKGSYMIQLKRKSSCVYEKENVVCIWGYKYKSNKFSWNWLVVFT
jgi:hypothetical protein